eukprot:7351802-Pyramimonas_sp.AAC.1
MACAHLPDASPRQLYGVVTELQACDSAGTPRADASHRIGCSQCVTTRAVLGEPQGCGGAGGGD